jgi:hypothetical protein
MVSTLAPAPHLDVDDALSARLQQALPTGTAIVALAAIVACENFRRQCNHTLRIESNGFCLLRQAGCMREDEGKAP